MIIPKLFVDRLVVLRDGKHVYDQVFHRGINILRGDNGTGKSTIIDLLYYALGGELSDWTEEQLLCDATLVEVSINKKNFCLKRDIVTSGKAAMEFYEGSSQEALKSVAGWFRYPNRRSSDKHSYSQQLFEMLGLPQHKTDESKNLTMHQIMRLMYVDQITQTTQLLMRELKYDNSITRKAIGEYLLGIDDLEAHNLRQELITATKCYDSIVGELNGINRVLRPNTTILRREQLEGDKREAETTISELEEKITLIRNKKISNLDKELKEKLNDVSRELESLSSKKLQLEEQKDLFSSEVVDTSLFKESIVFRRQSLEQSRLTSAEFGELSFKYCPACLALLEEHVDPKKCGLCRTPLSDSERHYSYIQMVNELNFQLKESDLLIERFANQLDEINRELPFLNKRIEQLKDEYQKLITNADSTDLALSELASEIGFYKSQLVNLVEKFELLDVIDMLRERKASANSAITKLKDSLQLIEDAHKTRYEEVYDHIEQIAKDILCCDGGYEDAFEVTDDVSFDFQRDKMSVNGRSKFSASSMVVLKNSIRLAIFIHCVDDDYSRLPRLFLMDNVEDKGMTEKRSQNFQRLIVSQCISIKTEFQLIFTTSMIDPDLDKTDLVIGPYYKKGQHTLAIG